MIVLIISIIVLGSFIVYIKSKSKIPKESKSVENNVPVEQEPDDPHVHPHK